MATTYSITHRRMQYSLVTGHEHVGWVKLMGGTVLSRDDVFAWMRQGNEFMTHSLGVTQLQRLLGTSSSWPEFRSS